MIQSTPDQSETEAVTAAPAATSPLVARGLRKAFGGVTVLDGVDLEVAPGEIHALLGSNGSGKSTFVKLVTGTYAADKGSEIVIGGTSHATMTPHAARELGVRTVHQEAPLIDQMTVAEHFGLDRGFPIGPGGWVRRRRLVKDAREALDRVGAHIDPDTLARDLLPAERAFVSLALAMTDLEPGGGLLVLDEATGLLPAPDAKPILEQVAELARGGVGVLMVTHRLGEVSSYCDQVTVLRDGAVVLREPVGNTDHDGLVDAMVGRTKDAALDRHQARVRKTLDAGVEGFVSVRDLHGRGVHGVSLDVRPGEILGLAGIVGSGASEVARIITGTDAATSGELRIDGAPTPKRWTPGKAIAAGVCFVPQDRHAEGGVLTLTLAENIVLPRYARYRGKRKVQRADVEGVIRDLDVQPPDADREFAQFSGGNQQKALLGKWLLLEPKVLVLDDPTYGVDPNARETLLAAVAALADRGAAVLVVSTEPEQLARVCDRVLVMNQGRINAELTGDHINELEISRACFN
jgi:ribose transport system ATP-binding protein